jgi:Na+/H+ antiporter NhaD/arsenite permease-like protein
MTYTSLLWVLPFAALLLSIALGPLAAPRFWSRHYGSVVGVCSLGLIAAVGLAFGWQESWTLTQHALVDHYVPFIILVGGLYVMASDIRITLNIQPTPFNNMLFLAVGTLLASILGTTGAAMVLLKPLIQMNHSRKQRVHQIVFFILLVANVGGCLTPVGDPPLFIGFLNGISFFWPLQHLALPFACVSLPLLALFYGVDNWYWGRESRSQRHPCEGRDPELSNKTSVVSIEAKLRKPSLGPRATTLDPCLRRDDESGIRTLRVFTLKGLPNLLCILGVTALTVLTPLFPETPFTWLSWTMGDLLRNGGIFCLALLSWFTTAPRLRRQNHFDWHPVREVAQIFAGIFLTIGPILNLLSQGAQGPFATLTKHLLAGGTPHPGLFFWATGALSAFLDNAPTYLIFFHFAGADPLALSTTLATTLQAISCGAVFMGALTYIGNAPNFMVRSIAQDEGIPMPSFFGYMAYSCLVLLPLFALVTWLFF